MKRIIKILFLLFLLLLIAAFIASIYMGYRSTIDILTSTFHQPYEEITQRLTPGKFKLLQRITFAMICILCGIYYYFDDLYR